MRKQLKKKAAKNQLKAISKSILSIFVIMMVLTTSVLPCIAATDDCTLTVNLEDKDKKPIDGLEVFICKIADISGTDYYPAEGFENSGISIAGIVNNPSAANTKIILNFVKEKNISSLTCVSSFGKAEFASVETGIWLVYCSDDGAYSFNPYIVFLPYSVDGKLHYEISSTPKTETNTPHDKSIYVVKMWEDSNNARGLRPDSITVYLKCDNEVIASAKLNSGNGWSYTFIDLPKEGQYSVEEEAIEKYIAKYNGDAENGFVVTNTYNGDKLPQTGQLWWPILMIAIAGIALVILGIIELRNKKNEKE